MKYDHESMLMKIAGKLKLKKLRWSLRRLHCPVSKEALVLEVGAGGNPYPRANVMLDAMEETIERAEKHLIWDRPLVLGLCEELPFKDKSFDFVIASHVLEHTDIPEKFLSELMRVGRAGYIETPDGWFEKMCAFMYHRLEVSRDGERLIIEKKKNWKPDLAAHLGGIKLSKSSEWAKFLRINPELTHLRFYWKDKIEYEILNPEVDASWSYPKEAINSTAKARTTLLSIVRDKYLLFRRWFFSQNRRNEQLKVFDLLRCPSCHSANLKNEINEIVCTSCAAIYKVSKGIPRLFPKKVDGFNSRRVNG